jgi:hypothetical protein
VLDVSVGHSAKLSVEASTWNPRFGDAEDNTVLIATFAGESLTTRIRW